MSDAERAEKLLDRFYTSSFATLYDAQLYEEYYARLVRRWNKIGNYLSVFILLTSSSAGVSAWALWSKPGWKEVWACVSSLAAIAAALQAWSAIPARIERLSRPLQSFRALRLDAQSFRHELAFEDPNEQQSIDELKRSMKREHRELRSALKAAEDLHVLDVFGNQRLIDKCQQVVDAALADESER